MYKEKYLKYKTKYLELKNQLGGGPNIIQEGGVELPKFQLPPFPWFNKKITPTKKIIPTKKILIEREKEDTTTDRATDITNAFTKPKDGSIKVELDINIELISETEFQALIEGLEKDTTTFQLTLNINKLPLDKYIRLGTAIGNNQRIVLLTIKLYGEDTKVPPELIKPLINNSNLSIVYFENIIDDIAAREVIELLENKKSIEFLFKKSTITPNSNEERKLSENELIKLNYGEKEETQTREIAAERAAEEAQRAEWKAERERQAAEWEAKKAAEAAATAQWKTEAKMMAEAKADAEAAERLRFFTEQANAPIGSKRA